MRYLSSEVKKAVAQAMSKSQRKWWKDGEIFSVRIYRTGRMLKRWGADENCAKFSCNGKGLVTRCNLVDFAWSDDPVKAHDEAVRALDYFVFGDKDEFYVEIM